MHRVSQNCKVETYKRWILNLLQLVKYYSKFSCFMFWLEGKNIDANHEEDFSQCWKNRENKFFFATDIYRIMSFHHE